MIPPADFLAINAAKIESNEVPFSTARNAAAGALRCLDAPDEAARRGLRFFAYSLHTYDVPHGDRDHSSGTSGGAVDNADSSYKTATSDTNTNTSSSIDGVRTVANPTATASIYAPISVDFVVDGKVSCQVPPSQSATLTHLASMGFQVAPGWTECSSDILWRAVMSFETTRANLGFGTDGAVIKINSQEVQRLLGDGSRAPKWAVAYKFTAEEGETDLLNITVQVCSDDSSDDNSDDLCTVSLCCVVLFCIVLC